MTQYLIVPTTSPRPAREDLAERVGGVLAVLYLVFNEGYLAGAAGEQHDVDGGNSLSGRAATATDNVLLPPGGMIPACA